MQEGQLVLKLTVKELLDITKGNLLAGEDLSREFKISTDTRQISDINFYLPLKGQNFDGHTFINDALNKGCRGYFIEKNNNQEESAEYVISVDNTLDAYLNIAHYARMKINPKVIGVTGSSGKTTTKEFLYSVLSTEYHTHKSRLNHNNEIGLCQTLLNMPKNTEYAVIEMGMRGPGEIELLSKYSEPDIAIITNIGTAHIGRLGSIKNIACAKCEIMSYLKKSGTLIAFDDDLIKKYCNRINNKIFYGKEFKITEQQENLTGFIYKDEYYKIPVTGEYNVINAIAAIETGKLAGISYENIKSGLLNYVPVGERGKTVILDEGIKLIIDCYNANPDSVMASIDSVVKTYRSSDIILVLGNMAELGEFEEELHRKVGEFISGLPVKMLLTIGEKAEITAKEVKTKDTKVKSFMTNSQAADYLLNNLKNNTVILFKASRCMKLEEIAEKIQAEISGE